MNVGDKHFEQKDIQTILKHTLLTGYLTRWANVFMNASFGTKIDKCHFVDCFAGRGIFGDGEAGSPIIAFESLFKVQESFKQQYDNKLTFNIHTVETEEKYYKKLIELFHAFKINAGQVFNRHGQFNTELEKLIGFTKGAPALYFIDPFGYKGVQMKDIQRILSATRHEVLINVMSYSIVRNYNIRNSHVELQKFFGVEEIPQDINEYIKLGSDNKNFAGGMRSDFEKLENKILDLYEVSLRKNSAVPLYILKKRIHSNINPNVYFHLLFVTRSRDGLKEMKDAMIEYDSLRPKIEMEYQRKYDIDRAFWSDDLFSEANKLDQYSYSDFVREFINKYNNESTTYGEVIDFFLQNSPLPFRSKINSKSIYDFSTELFKKNKYVTCSRHSYANYKSASADNLKITSSFPSGYKPKEYSNIEEPTLF